MFVGGKCHDRLVQLIGTDTCLCFPESSRMRQQTISKCMITEVLTILISITAFGFRRMKQSQPDCMIIRFIPTVLTVIQDRYAIGTVCIRQVCPILCIYFIGCLRIISSFNTSDTQVIGCFGIWDTQRELSFQQSIGRLPVYFIVEINTVGTATFIQTDILFEYGLSVTFLYAKGFS